MIWSDKIFSSEKCLPYFSIGADKNANIFFKSADSPFDEQLDREAEKLIHAVDDLVNEATKDSRPQPSQEDVVRCTEQITKKIQELLLSAQAGRHSWWISKLYLHFLLHCSIQSL